MQKIYLPIFMLILGLSTPIIILADENAHPIQDAHMALSYFKQLEGEWIGAHMNHEGKEEIITLVYRTVSSGTAVEERIFANTPREMITVYHGSDDTGLLMTHYCALGNQPRLELKNTHEMVFNFTYLDGVGIDHEETGHMGGMRLTVIDENTLKQEWDYYEGGEVKNTSVFNFKRK